jgi:hypothetical protein
MEDKKSSIIVGPVQLNFCNVWEPKAIEGSDTEKYSVQIRLHKKKDRAQILEIQNTVKALANASKESIFKGKMANLKFPLRDGDTNDDETLKGYYFFNASSTAQPGIVDRNRKPIIDQDEVYSGVIAYVSVNFYAFNKNGNKGIAAGLNNILKYKDGERIAGKPSAQSDFKNLDIEIIDDDFLEDVEDSDDLLG